MTTDESCKSEQCSIPSNSNENRASDAGPTQIQSPRNKIALYGIYVLSFVAFVLWLYIFEALSMNKPAYGYYFLGITVAYLIARRLIDTRTLNTKGGLDAVIANGKPTLLQVYSDTCIPCLAVKPLVAQLSRQVKNQANIVNLSVLSKTGIKAAKHYAVVATPTFVLFDAAGKEVWRAMSPPTRDQVLALNKEIKDAS